MLSPDEAALFTDLYELTMLQAYHSEGMTGTAVFDLFARELPENRNYLVACGIDDVLRYLEGLRFSPDAIAFLESLRIFSAPFLRDLEAFRFTGSVFALPEGTPVFADEPIVEVVAPIAQAQFIETFLLNQVTFQTMIASKGARAVAAAAGRPVIDFGARRMHGTDAALKAARTLYLVGFASTSNVLAARNYGIPAVGTMAHSYIEAHDDEIGAFRAFAKEYPDTILLVDTYDTEDGVRNVIRLARELGEAFRVRGIRLDSGDLADLARRSRALLDEAGLEQVEIIASGGLDEYSVARLVAAGAPIDSFAVGTNVGVSSDMPKLDSAYKLVAYAERDRMKLSPGKVTLPGRKQIYRRFEDGTAAGDVIGVLDEDADLGMPLLEAVMLDGVTLPHARTTLAAGRERARAAIGALPERLRSLQPATPPYPVRVSERLREKQARLAASLEARGPRARAE